MKEKVKCFLIFLCCCGFCAAQQVVSSGGYTEKSEISFNWILGGSLSTIPGQNPNTSPILQNEELDESGISFKVYPSPAIDFINIEITPANDNRFFLELFDDSGIKILDQEFTNQSFLRVNISDIPCGIYFLKIFLQNQDHPLKVDKIVKVQNNPL
jgi:hypothetical protein